MENSETLYCSFCGKAHYEVLTLIAGPKAFICNECVELCGAIILRTKTEGLGPKDDSAVACDLTEEI